MGNAVGPVSLIAAGIYLGYLTLTGRAQAFADFLSGGTVLPKATGSTRSSTSGSNGSVATNLGNALGAAIGNATPQQAAANAQIPLTVDALVGTSGG